MSVVLGYHPPSGTELGGYLVGVPTSVGHYVGVPTSVGHAPGLGELRVRVRLVASQLRAADEANIRVVGAVGDVRLRVVHLRIRGVGRDT